MLYNKNYLLYNKNYMLYNLNDIAYNLNGLRDNDNKSCVFLSMIWNKNASEMHFIHII